MKDILSKLSLLESKSVDNKEAITKSSILNELNDPVINKQNQLTERYNQYSEEQKNKEKEQLDENLRDWFKEKWVRFGPDGKIRGDCARGDDSEGKPKCLPQAKAHALGKKGRASAAARKRREDPNPERSGSAINVATKKKTSEDAVESTLTEFAPSPDFGGGGGNYFQELASAWYNGINDTGDIEKNIKSQEDIERLLERGIICPDGVTRKFHIDYNANYDGVVIFSDDYYRYGSDDETIDSRTGKKWGPYDFMEFSGEQLDENVNPGVAEGSNKNQEAIRRIQKMLNDKFGANLDIDGILGPLTLKSINKFMPNAKVGLADDPTRTTAVQGKKVKTKDAAQLDEKWSQKYKNSINCSHPRGFSQRAHCAGKKKHNESVQLEMTCPDCGMCKTHGDHTRNTLDEACWKGYHREGNKKMFGKTYPNCVKNESQEPDDDKKLKGFHQSLGNAVRGRVSQMQANMAILKAQHPDTWLWEPGDIVYSRKTGRTYEIIGHWIDNRGTPKYLYRGNDEEQGTFVADKAHQTLIKVSGKQGVVESQTAKAGIVQTDVYGTHAYHAKCLEPGCDWESRRYDKIKQAQAAAQKHSEKHFNKQGVAEDSLNEFAPGDGSDSGRWYTDDQMIDIVGPDWAPEDDVSHLTLSQLLEDAQAWLDDQGYSVIVENVEINPEGGYRWKIYGEFYNPRFAKKDRGILEGRTMCPECGGPAYSNSILAEKQDACYHKVKSRYKVWPSAYASGALVQCRKKGAKNWGNKSESVKEAANLAQQAAIAIAMKKAGKKPKSSSMKETINPETLNSGFEKTKQILNGKYYLIARAMPSKNGVELFVYAYSVTDPKLNVGSLILELGKRPEDGELYLSAKTIDVLTAHRGMGIAYEMYKFVNELGNDILPSSQQTEQGRAMWKRFGKAIRQPKPLSWINRFFKSNDK